MDTVEIESETTVDTSVAMMPGRNGGVLKVGPGGTNKGGPGRPRTSVRHLARDASSKSVKTLVSIRDGEATQYKDADGNVIPVTPQVGLNAAKALLDVALGTDSIPEALLVANVRLVSRLHELFPDVVTRPFTQGELGYFGDLLEQDLGQARVVRPEH